MKKTIIIGCMLWLGCAAVNGQTSYEAARLMGGDLQGTARYVGMGGAMGALGTDLSTMSTNPAGIGLYRTCDMNVSVGINSLGSKGKFGSSSDTENKTFGSLDNMGMVLSMDVFEGSLNYFNIGFNFKRSKGFSKNFTMYGSLFENNMICSQQQQMANMLSSFDDEMNYIGHELFPLNNIISDDYRYPYAQQGNKRYYAPWLVLLAGDAGLIDDETGNPIFLPTDCYYHSEEKGGIDEADINLSMNLNDRLYLGATVGIYNVDYDRYSYYEEGDVDGLIYSLENWYRTEGHGFDIKLGAIVRPIEDSPLRLGFAIHTPTWYRLTDINSAYIYSSIVDDNGRNRDMDTQWSVAYGDNYYTDYRLETPWKFNLSGGYTVGSSFALGVEYEYSDYSTAKLKYDDGDDMSDANDAISNNMKGVHTLKTGIEFRPVKDFAMRCGYNYITAAFNKNGWKGLPVGSVQTDTEFLNGLDAQNYTFGIGYSGEDFYADMSYQLSVRNSEFYPFENIDLAATKVTDKRNQLLFTFGLRF